MAYSKNFDVIIIGGSYAVLSAAMALGPKKKRHYLTWEKYIPTLFRRTSENFRQYDTKSG